MSTPPPPRPREDSTYRTTTLRDLSIPYGTRLIEIGPAESVNESSARPFALEPLRRKPVRVIDAAAPANSDPA